MLKCSCCRSNFLGIMLGIRISQARGQHWEQGEIGISLEYVLHSQATIHYLPNQEDMDLERHKICLACMHMKLGRTIWGIRVVRVGGSISASRFLDLNSSQRRAGNVVRPFGEYTLHTNVSNAFTSCGSSPLTNSVDDRAPSPRLRKQSMGDYHLLMRDMHQPSFSSIFQRTSRPNRLQKSCVGL